MPDFNRPLAAAILARWPALPAGEIPVRILFPGSNRFAHDLSFVSHYAGRLETCAANSGSEYFELAKTVRTAPFKAGESGPLPSRFTSGRKAIVADLLIDAQTLPADFLDDPPDLRELFLSIDLAASRAWADPVPADHPTDRANQRLKRLRKSEAVEIHATVVCAPPALFEPGPADLPCLVLATFDQKADVPRFLEHIASYLNSLAGGQYRDEDRSAAVAMMADERFVRDRRRELPESLCDGHTVYLCDLLVHRPFLAGGVVAEHTLPCLAEWGDRGRIELLPVKG